MRNRIIDYTFTPGSRSITLTKFDVVTIPDLRLIVNETQKYIICSSMQKDLIEYVNGNVIEFVDSLPALQAGDQLTIEVDTGDDIIYSGGTDWFLQSKKDVVAGVVRTFDITKSMGKTLSECISDAPVAGYSTPQLYAGFIGANVVNADLSEWSKIIGDEQCRSTFENCKKLETVDLSNITVIQGANATYRMFLGCNRLQSIKFDNLTSVSGRYCFKMLFYQCQSLVEIRFPKLTYMDVEGDNDGQRTFQDCFNLQVADFRNLETLTGYSPIRMMFYNCSSLRTLYFLCNFCSSTEIYNNITGGLVNLQNLYLHGIPQENIILNWSPNLTYESLKGIFDLIANTQGALTDKTLQFSTSLQTYHVTPEEKVIFDELYDKVVNAVSDGGKHWSVNITKSKVIGDLTE